MREYKLKGERRPAKPYVRPPKAPRRTDTPIHNTKDIIAPLPTVFIPSDYQKAIFDFAENGKGCAIIEAVAGSGKSTVLLMIANNFPRRQKALFLAFNKNIAEYLSTRVPNNVLSKTFHSICYGALQDFYRVSKLNLDIYKVYNITSGLLKGKEERKYIRYVTKLVSLAKNVGIGVLIPDEEESWYDLIAHQDLTLEDTMLSEKRAIEISQQVLSISTKEGRESVDFDDLIYLSLYHKIKFPKYSWILVDEAQDVNSCQIEIVKKILTPDGRAIFVGDCNQGIYQFRGADVNSMNIIKESFNCKVLPLSISYRCPKSVVQLAQKMVPEIQYKEDAEEGIVECLNSYGVNFFTNSDVILCRNTAPLVGLAYNLIVNGVGCRIVGKDIGANLITIIKKQSANTLLELKSDLVVYMEKEKAKYIERKNPMAALNVEDNVTCILNIISKMQDGSVIKLMDFITRMFDDTDTNLLTLSTCHRAKGMEYDRVFILDKEKYMPSKYARLEHHLKQEKNIEYVAVTRAKKELYFITTEGFNKNVKS